MTMRYLAPRLALLCAAAGAFAGAAPPAGEFACSFVSLPKWVVSRQTHPIAVRYRVPVGRTATVNFEVWDDAAYHIITHKDVTGTGTVTFDAEIPGIRVARTIRFICWIGTDWRTPLNGEIVRGPLVKVITRRQAQRLEQLRRVAKALTPAVQTPRGTVGIYVGPDSTWGKAFARKLEGQLGNRGLAIRRLLPTHLDNPFLLVPEVIRTLILIDAKTVPVGAAVAVQDYVDGGGRLLVLGGNPFTRMLYPLDGHWLPAAAYREGLMRKLSTHVLFAFDADDDTPWERASSHFDVPSTARPTALADGGKGKALFLNIINLRGWDTFAHAFPSDPGIEPDAWLTLRARGDADTPQLSVELREKDGSRWIAVAPLTDRWQTIALPPEAFKYWHDSTSTTRGGAGDHVSLTRVAEIHVGLAFTHTNAVAPGRHRIWIDDIGWAPNPGDTIPEDAFGDARPTAPVIETVSPKYKTFAVTNLAGIRPNSVQAIVPPLTAPKFDIMSPVPRPQGTGYHKQRRWRFIPLAECRDRTGRFCGTAAGICLYSRSEGGGMAASLGVLSPEFFTDDVAEWSAVLTDRLHRGIFLYEGGSAYYASFGNETMPVGAIITNRSPEAVSFSLRLQIENAGGKQVWRHTWSEILPADTDRAVEGTWYLGQGDDAPYTITTELLVDGHVIDRLRHQVGVWRPDPTPRFIQRHRGDFILDGHPWYVHGVNYMPSSGIGIEDSPYFEYWLDPQPYDPDVVERDLEDVEAIGFNMISVFQYHRSMTSRNLLDLLMRCRRHHLKVNLSLRPGTPMNFRWPEIRDMIVQGRLAQNDTIFAYDLAWEPFWGGHSQRRIYDPLWKVWIEKQYGDVAAAEKHWNHRIPRTEDGTVTNPSDEQTNTEGPWCTMVHDYYRFLNGLLHTRYGKARELVRGVDPHHLVSFRMSMACDPTRDNRSLTYDFVGLKNAVDILEPEAYGRIGDWEQVKPGWFTVAYGRHVAPDLPLIWAEFGTSVWDRSRGISSPNRLAFAARFYQDFYTMVYRSGANGTVCWWFPGGYRCNEHSDYGILNPDRSWRAVTHVIHDWRQKMTGPRPAPAPAKAVPFDRLATCRQIPGIYAQIKDAFWKAVDEGRQPKLESRNSNRNP